MSVSKATEVERKYTVPAGATLPDLSTVTGVTATEAQPLAALDAIYVDTADRTLLTARIAVRRRTGGHDAGWHVKLPAPTGRVELQAPIDAAEPEAVPAVLTAALRSRVRGRPLEPIARIRTERRGVVVRGADGRAVEVVDDLVTATDLDAGVVRSWREWEAEQVGDPAASAALLERIDAALRGAGAAPSDSPAKLAQALGLVGAPTPAMPATAGEILVQAVARHTEQLHRGLQTVALDGDPDGTLVHELRKTLRRIRSLLALKPIAGQAGAVLKDRLGPLGTTLGEARDPLVQAQVAEALLTGLTIDTPGFAAARSALVDEPRAGLAQGTAAATAAVQSAEALEVLAALEDFAADGPKAGGGEKALVRAGGRVVDRARQRANQASSSDIESLHTARKAAKRARFVAEELVALGVVKPKSPLATSGREAEAVQDALGDHRDLALLIDRLTVLSAEFTASGTSAFALGVVAERGRRRLAVLLDEATHRLRRFR